MSRRVAIVGQGLVTAFGETWEENRIKILECQNAVRHMQEWEIVQGLITKLAAPCDNFVAPEHYTRKKDPFYEPCIYHGHKSIRTCFN